MSDLSQIVLMVCITTIVCHTISCINSTINRFINIAKQNESKERKSK